MDKLSTHDMALIVIDVQQGFLSPYTRKALPSIYRLIDSAKFPLIIATKFYNPEGSPFRKFIHWDRLSTAEETALDSKVEAAANLVIPKPTYSAGPQIEAALHEAYLHRALFVGIDTDVCVLQNSAYLFDHGFEVHIDLSGCATNGGPDAEAAVPSLLGRTLGGDYIHPAVLPK
ncbi:cysteine hydrolase [Leucobacter sp. OH2974_COT-288]|nr:cysteine hydrolase [Leucobacter sp. OH2974_COT-288]